MKFFILAALLFSSSAFALTETIQTLTPGARQFEGRVGGDYAFGSASSNDSPAVDVDIAGYHTSVLGYYGFDANNSFGAEIEYESITETLKYQGTTAKTKTEGLKGITLGYKGAYDILGAGSLFLSAKVTIPTEKGNIDIDSQKTSVTNGQITAPIAVGFVMPVPQAKIGAIATYTFANTGSGSIHGSGLDVSVDTKDGGGYQFDFFAEFPRAMNLNIQLEYERTYAVHTHSSGGDGTWQSGGEIMSLTGAARIPVTSNLEILPRLAYMTPLHLSEEGYSRYNIFTVGADARFLF